MANGDYVVRLRGEDSLSPTLEKVKKGIAEVSDKSSRLNDISEQFKKIDSSSAPLKKKLRDIQKLLGEMQYNGDNTSELFLQMSQAAGEYADALNDARAAVNAFADDQLSLKAGIGVFQGLTAAASVTTGVIGLFGEQNEKVTQAILKVQSALSILNGLQTISNLLNKDSVLVLKLRQIQMNLMTAAQVKNAVATAACSTKTKIDTAVQTAWNVAKAVAKALLGDFTGLALVAAGAVATYAVATAGSTEEQKKQNKALEASKELMGDFSQTYASSASELISKYLSLKKSFEDAVGASALTREEFEKHRKELNKMGFEVKTVNDLDNIYINNTESSVKALQLRAKAAAYAALKTKMLAQELEALMNLETGVSTKQRGDYIDDNDFDRLQDAYKYYGMDTDNMWKRNGRWLVGIHTGRKHYTQESADVLNRYDREMAQKRMDNVESFYEKGMKEIQGELESIPFDFNIDPEITTDSNKTKNKAIDRLEEELKKIQDKIKQEQSKYNSASYDADEMERLRKRERQLQNELELRKAISEIVYDDGRIDTTLKNLKSLKDIQLKLDINDKEGFDLIEKLMNEQTANLLIQLDNNSYLKAKDKIKTLETVLNNFEINDVDLRRKIEVAISDARNQAVIDIVAKINDEKFQRELITLIALKPELEVQLNFDISNAIRRLKVFFEDNPDLADKFNIDVNIDEESLNASLSNLLKRSSDLYIQCEFHSDDTDGISNVLNHIIELEEFLTDVNRHADELYSTLDNIDSIRLNELVVMARNWTSLGDEDNGSFEYAKKKVNELKKLKQTESAYNKDIQEILDKAYEVAVAEHNKRAEILGESIIREESIPSIQNQKNNNYFEPNSVEDKRLSLNNAKSMASQYKSDFEEGIISADEFTSKIDELNAKLEELGLKKIDLVIDTKNMDKVISQTEQAAKARQEMANGIQEVGNSMLSLGSALSNVIEDEGGQKAALIGTAIGQIALTFAKSLNGTFTPWDWIAGAISGVATLVTLVSQLKGFASGGIVGGQSFSGDNVLARLNSGEMVINRQDQNRLWNFIKDGSPSSRAMGGNVTFTLQGSTLQGVLNNYNRKNRQVR